MEKKLCEQASLYGSVDIAAVPHFLTLLSAPFTSKKPLSESVRLFENLHLLRMLFFLQKAHKSFIGLSLPGFLLVLSWSLLN